MAKGGEVTVDYQILGEPHTGVWCDHCALPSAIEVFVALLIDGRLASVTSMRRCDSPDHDEDERQS